MNRAERRRAGREIAADLNAGKELGYECVWKGCDSCYNGNMPRGWRNLVIIEKDLLNWNGFGADRDAVLCPEHVAEFDGLLKPLEDGISITMIPNKDGGVTYLSEDLGEKG